MTRRLTVRQVSRHFAGHIGNYCGAITCRWTLDARTGRRLALITLLCCLLLVVAIVGIWALGIALNSALLFGTVLLCSLGHFQIMRAWHHHEELSGQAVASPAVREYRSGPREGDM